MLRERCQSFIQHFRKCRLISSLRRQASGCVCCPHTRGRADGAGREGDRAEDMVGDEAAH